MKGTTTAATAEPMCGHHQAPLCQQCTKFPSTVRRVFGETELGASGQQKDALLVITSLNVCLRITVFNCIYLVGFKNLCEYWKDVVYACLRIMDGCYIIIHFLFYMHSVQYCYDYHKLDTL